MFIYKDRVFEEVFIYDLFFGLLCDEILLFMLEELWFMLFCNIFVLFVVRVDVLIFLLFIRGYGNVFDEILGEYFCVIFFGCDFVYIDEKMLLNMRCEDEGIGLMGDCVCFVLVFLLNEVLLWGFVVMFILYGV